MYLNMELWVPAAFVRSCEIKNGGSPSEVSEKKTKRNLMIKELWSLDII